ncbi:MAG TPA: glucose-6-phosphate dehydrogenase [Bacteroidales bacterium]|nr:glucose-6-phosphate dehydrogenase [Bacteroidales bacterium]
MSNQSETLFIIIFGATGDLTYRKLAPALYSLNIQGSIPERFYIVGVGRKNLTDEEFRARMREGIKFFSYRSEIRDSSIEELLEHFLYIKSDMVSHEGYTDLKSLIKKKEDESGGAINCIYYLATPPDLFSVIPFRLHEAGLTSEDKGYIRFVFEKPFGYEYASCRKLNEDLHRILSEKQIYRIDHYLGKETVQNILVMRFSNGLFEPLWNRNYIHHIQITSAESIGVENRGGYYDSAGALRDMVQNHLLQMVGLTAMEPPSSIHPDAIRNEVLKVFQSLQPLKEEEVPEYVIRGQYTASKVMGQCIPAYRQEPGVNPASRTETYVAMKFFINNWRWGGVPFFIRTGKRLPTRVTEIVVNFKPTPHFLFHVDDMNKAINQLIIRIQPDEGIVLKFGIKKPGSGFNVENVSMDFHYSDLLKVRVPEAYERLLGDVIMGDSTLFARDDIVETAWKFLEPVQKAWAENRDIKIYGYPAGTWGPEEAGKIIGDGLEWRYPCKNLADDGTFCEL